jgi:hypothetical protein
MGSLCDALRCHACLFCQASSKTALGSCRCSVGTHVWLALWQMCSSCMCHVQVLLLCSLCFNLCVRGRRCYAFKLCVHECLDYERQSRRVASLPAAVCAGDQGHRVAACLQDLVPLVHYFLGAECLLHVSTFATTRVALPTGVEPG